MKYILIYYRYVCTEVCLRNILLYTPLFDYKKSLKEPFSHQLQKRFAISVSETYCYIYHCLTINRV